MRALLVVRPDAYRRFGGDTVLAQKTAEAVRELGVTADLAETERPDARGYDLAHVFNVGEPDVCEKQLAACRCAGVPIVLSPVWLDITDIMGKAALIERALAKASSAAQGHRRVRRLAARDARAALSYREHIRLRRRERAQAALLRQADVLLPNSALEARDCAVRLGVREVPFVIVPIGVDANDRAQWRLARSGVVCVGRIERRKNQLLLAFALREEPVPLTLVGTSFDSGLVQLIRRWANPEIKFTGWLPRSQLLELLAQAEVYAMPSWTETAGIASLEAAASGAKLVVGDRGAEIEYFGNAADYADPADPVSIRAAILRSLARQPRRPGDELDARIQQFNWGRAGRETLRGYEVALRARPSSVPASSS